MCYLHHKPTVDSIWQEGNIRVQVKWHSLIKKWMDFIGQKKGCYIQYSFIFIWVHIIVSNDSQCVAWCISYSYMDMLDTVASV